jgi:hypothetical protein
MLTQAPTYGWSDEMKTALIMGRLALKELADVNAYFYETDGESFGPTESHDVGGEPWRRDQT